MSNMRAAILAGYIPGDLDAFRPDPLGKIRLYKPVLNVIEKTGDAIADGVDWVVDKVIDPVMTTVGNVIDSALSDPAKAIAQIAAIATQQYWALPLIEGASVAAHGGDLSDVLEATAKAYVMQEVGSYVGDAAGSWAGEAFKEAGPVAAKVAEAVVGAAAGSAAVAVVAGQDPIKALASGGISAGTAALLGQVPGFADFAKNNKVAANVISSTVSSALAGRNPTQAMINSLISSTGIVQDIVKGFDPNGTDKYDKAQVAIITDILTGTATAALTGGSASNVVRSAMLKAGSAALGSMLTDSFKTATAGASAAYQKAEDKSVEIESNEAAQKTAVANYNKYRDDLQTRVTKQNELIAAANTARDTYNNTHTQADYDAAIAAKKAADEYITTLNKDYADTFKPNLEKYGGELDKLKETHATLTGDYEKLIQAFSTKTDALTGQLDPLFLTSNRAFVEAMSPGFNAEEYRKLNGLAADADPYEHFLSTGQFQNAPTNNKAAEAEIGAQRTRLVNEALAAKGVNITTADPAQVSKILDNLDAKYGDNVAALRAATAQDILAGNTKPLDQLVADQKAGNFRIEVSGHAYGQWAPPPSDKFTMPAGLRLATQDEFNNSTARLMYGDNGIPVWVADDPKTAPQNWDSATGSYVNTLPTVVVTAPRPTDADKLLAYGSDPSSWKNVVSQSILNGAQTLVNWAKESGNSTLINTAANVIKAGGGFLESINGISVLAGYAPGNTALGKFSTALQNLGKANNTQEYQDAVKNMQAIIGDAKGVGGTLKAIYGAFKSAPLEFLAEYVGVEGIQEVAPLLIGGVAASGAKGAALAMKYGQAVASKMGTAAGMTASIMSDIAESAGGAASSAYTDAYNTAKKAGKSDAEADKIALDIAQRSAFVAAGATAVSMGIGGAALEKAILGKSGTGVGDALQALGDFAKSGSKITIKEGLSEAGEEGITQAFLESQLYKLDPTRDVAGNITAAAAFGAIAGGPIAGGAYGASRAGDVISNALMANADVANAVTNSSSATAAADALKNLGVTDSVTQANLLNTKYDAQYTSSDEAAAALAKRGDYVYTDADVKALTGNTSNLNLANAVEQYVDPRTVDLAEVKAAAAAEGYTITDEEAAKLVGQKDEASAIAAAKAQFDPLATTYDEAKAIFTEKYGYTPSFDEVKQFVKSVAETQSATDIGAYVNPRQVTYDEAKKYLSESGYNPTDAEIKKFVGQVNEAQQATNISAYVDPRYVDEQEVKDAYAALGLKKPTADDVKALIGQYAESDLTGKATTNLPTARYNSILEQLDALSNGGAATPEVLKAIETVKSDFTSQVKDLGFKIDDQTGKLTDKITTTEQNILTKIAENEKAGMTRDQATQKAIADVATDLGTTKEDILKRIGTTETNLTKTIDALSKDVGALSTKVGDVETNILTKMAEYEKAGITRDEALSKAIDDVAKNLGTTKEALLTQIGTTETALKNQVSGVETSLGTKITESQEAILKELGLAKTGLSEEIAGVKQDLTTKMSDVETNVLSRVDQYEKAGIARDEALGLAIDDVATQLGTTRTDILTQIGKTEAALKTDINTAKTQLQEQIGTKGTQATQTDLDAIINSLQQQGAYDPTLDYNGDKVIDQKDKIAIENALRQQTGQNVDQGFVFQPAVGSKWGPTGIFGQLATDQAATQKAIADAQAAAAADAEKTRQAAARNALNQVRLGNVNSMMSMLSQAPDTGGQQVTVKAADPSKIGYIYDWSSIFANPSQEKMFASPYGAYAQGGVVRDEVDDVNDELLKILRG